MDATRKAHTDAYQRADRAAMEIRRRVGEQLLELMSESTLMGSREEVTIRVRKMLENERRITEAIGRQRQAREMGLPIAAHVEAEHDGRAGLRQAVMELAKACGCWAAAIDFEELRAALDRNDRSEGEDGEL